MEIIGLSGYARSGKDEAAKILVEEHGFTRVAFADKLREVLYQLNPRVDAVGYNYINHLVGTYPVYLQQVIDEYGWDGYKETYFGPEIRRLLQRLGTEAGRMTLWDTIWIDAALNTVEAEKVVVTDARFFNEFDAVVERGGEIWRIQRAGVGPANDHPSETEAVKYDKFSEFITNDGSLEEFQKKVRQVYEEKITSRC